MQYFDLADGLSAQPPESATMRHASPLQIPTGDDHPVWADYYEPRGGDGGSAAGSVVVLCHGMKGHRRWGFIPRLASSLQAAGLPVFAIDFSHNGVAGGDPGVSGRPVYREPEMMKRNTIDRERRDLAAVVAWVRSGGSGGIVPRARIGLWGHSRGATSVLLNALEQPSAVSAIATWSAPAYADIYRPRQKRRWREAGEYEWLEGASGQRLAMGVCFLDDLEAHRGDYALADRSAGLEVPHLIVHGEMDLVIPVTNADRFAAARPPGVEIKKVLLRTGHTYGIARSDDPDALKTAINETVEWFRRHLSAEQDRT
jgi:dienelactone hydrolase